MPSIVMSAWHSRFGLGRRLGTLLALLALALQFEAGLHASPAWTVQPMFDGICHADQRDSQPAGDPGRHDQDCVLCPLCLAFAQAMVLPPTGPSLPAPHWPPIGVASATAASVAPIPGTRLTPQPRAPPASA